MDSPNLCRMGLANHKSSPICVLGIVWLCFGLGLVDCNPQLRNICIKKLLGF